MTQSETPQVKPWQACVLTLYPEMFPGPLAVSLAGRALRAGLWGLQTINIRDFGDGKHQAVDDTPAGGGPGMVMRADVLSKALNHAKSCSPEHALICLSPRGKKFTQSIARSLSERPGVTLLCGHFEGIDERLFQAHHLDEISLGDFVLSGGEIASFAVVDAVVRLLPGVVGSPHSLDQESFEDGLLEYPHYTRPALWNGLKIPEVLTSGNHQRMAQWRQGESERITKERRPDLWSLYKKKSKGSN